MSAAVRSCDHKELATGQYCVGNKQWLAESGTVRWRSPWSDLRPQPNGVRC